MGLVRSLVDVRPPVVDGLTFTQARLDEAQLADELDWQEVHTWDLSPVDVDPDDPQRRTLTTVDAAVSDGWLRLTWLTAGGDEATDEPLRFAPRPTTRDVASLTPKRTIVQGVELGDFRDPSEDPHAADAVLGTRPTKSAVEAHIQTALGDVEAELERRVPDNLRWRRNVAAALRAAVLVIGPNEESEADTTLRATYAGMYQTHITALARAIRHHIV